MWNQNPEKGGWKPRYGAQRGEPAPSLFSPKKQKNYPNPAKLQAGNPRPSREWKKKLLRPPNRRRTSRSKNGKTRARETGASVPSPTPGPKWSRFILETSAVKRARENRDCPHGRGQAYVFENTKSGNRVGDGRPNCRPKPACSPGRFTIEFPSVRGYRGRRLWTWQVTKKLGLFRRPFFFHPTKKPAGQKGKPGLGGFFPLFLRNLEKTGPTEASLFTQPSLATGQQTFFRRVILARGTDSAAPPAFPLCPLQSKPIRERLGWAVEKRSPCLVEDGPGAVLQISFEPVLYLPTAFNSVPSAPENTRKKGRGKFFFDQGQ